MLTYAVQQSLGSVLVDLLPLMIAAALVPIPIIIILLLLGSQGGLAKGAAFLAGALTVRLAQGAAFGFLFANDAEAKTEAGGNLIVSGLLLVLGILMLITAYRKWAKEEDPDAPPPRWMAALGGLSTLTAFALGAGMVAVAAKQWVFTLSAIGVLTRAQLGAAASVALFVCYMLAAQAFGLVAVIALAVAPRAAGAALTRIRAWLERYDRQILVAASLIFGLYFLFKGITGLVD
jgi:hypothetical protein